MENAAVKKKKDMKIVRTFVLFAIALVWLLPAFGLLITAFRSRERATETGWWEAIGNFFTETWTTANFEQVLFEKGLGENVVNSFAVVIPATVLPIMFAAFAAYAFTFLEFKGRSVIFAIIVSLLVVPIQVALIPVLKAMVEFQKLTDIQIVGTFPAVWFVHAAFAMPLAIFILRNYMATLPGALIEAALIDGASHFKIFWQLVIPMSVPALASFAIFQFLWVWNDLLIAQIFLGGKNKVVTQALMGFLGQYSEGWQVVAAGSFITLLVPLIVFFSLQRYFVRGLTAGSVK